MPETEAGAVRRPGTLSRTVLVCTLLAALSACAPGADLPPLPPVHQAGYRLGGGDEVRLITFGEEQLTGRFLVDDAGDIAVPLLGNVHAAGLTPMELGERVTQELKSRNLLRQPSVSVEVLAYRPIFVLGEVNKPGQYPYQPGMTMLTAVAVAGGFTYRAVQSYASDIRTSDGQASQGKITPRSFIAPGDVIKVYERNF